MTAAGDRVELIEVGPRDGFQGIETPIPTKHKIECIAELHRAGIRKMEVTSFVSPEAVPQLADAAEVARASTLLPDLEVRTLVPTARRAKAALEAGPDMLVFVISVSEAHSRSNVRRSPQESLDELRLTSKDLPEHVGIRVDLSTAFDCPYEGAVDPGATLELLRQVADLPQVVEICVCDTTGRVVPRQVTAMTEAARNLASLQRLAFHAHDTFGTGVANVLAAYEAGIRRFDASFAGIGGCPFAPGASGNVATEDLVWAFDAMGVESGIDLPTLLGAARLAAALPAANAGGRVREAMRHATVT